MKVVLIAQEFSHNGGAEKAASDHYRVLSQNGDDVWLFGDFLKLFPEAKGVPFSRGKIKNYRDLEKISTLNKLSMALRSLFDFILFWKLLSLLIRVKPDVAHIHKVKQLSPAVFLALRMSGVRTIATIHDHNLTCLNSTRIQGDGNYCKLKKCSYQTALKTGCVGNSKALTGFSIVEFSLRRRLCGDLKTVSEFVFPSRFLLNWTNDSIPKIKSNVVFNFTFDTAVAPITSEGYVLYFGRLSEEKGLGSLPALADKCPEMQFKVVGDGPLRQMLEREKKSNIQLTGALYGRALAEAISGASVVLLPSICFENAPLSILEAFMNHKPVVASDIGGIPELVEDGETGFLFPPDQVEIAAERLKALLCDSTLRARMGRNAYQKYVDYYSADSYVRQLKKIYYPETITGEING